MILRLGQKSQRRLKHKTTTTFQQFKPSLGLVFLFKFMGITRVRLQKLAGLLREQVEDFEEPEKEMKAPEETKKKIFVLVGPPSVGKSTWIQNTFEETPYIVSRDDIVEQVSSSHGWTYDDMFATPPAEAQIGEVDEKYGEVVKAPEWMTWTPTAFSKVLGANGRVQAARY